MAILVCCIFEQHLQSADEKCALFFCFFSLYSFSIASEHLHKNTYNQIKDIPVEGGCGSGKIEGNPAFYNGLDLGNEVQMWILNASQNDTSDALSLTHAFLSTSDGNGEYNFKNI